MTAEWGLRAPAAGHLEAPMPEIYVDADGCPVKDEVYRVAGRYGLKVWVVANAWLRVPEGPLVSRVTVSEGLDRTDDWIAERIGPGDVAVTADVPLADRCIKRGARAIAPDGRPFTPESIGATLATRDLMTALRDAGEIKGGGRPFTRQDRSRFLGALDGAIQAIQRSGR
jgi:uncharacterized protein YaiI (UPF0178 family)